MIISLHRMLAASSRPVIRHDVVKKAYLRHLSIYGASYPESQQYVSKIRDYYERAGNVLDGDNVEIEVAYEQKGERLFSFRSKSISVQSMPKPVRNLLLADGCVEVDIKAAAPSIMLSLCKKYDIKVPMLEEYCANMEAWTAMLENKKVRNVLLFGGDEIADNRLPGWAIEWKKEIKTMTEELKPYFNDVWIVVSKRAEEDVDNQRKKKIKLTAVNVEGKFLSRVYNRFENLTLKEIDMYGRSKRWWGSRVSFVFDGMVIYKPSSLELQELENHVKETLGLDIMLRKKPIGPGMDVDLSKPPAVLAVTNQHLEAAEMFLLEVSDILVRSGDNGNTVYIKSGGVWIDDKETVHQQLTMMIMKRDIRVMKVNEKTGECSYDPFSSIYHQAQSIKNAMIPMIKIENEFSKRLVLGTEMKLAYLDGYWEFTQERCEDTGMYGRFVRGGSYDTGVIIRHSFPDRVQEDMDFVMNNILKPLFKANPDQLPLFLTAVARALAGHTDKISNGLEGGRDSGKSVSMQLVRAAFSVYCCSFNSEDLSSAGGGDSFRQNQWIIEMEHARIAVMSEVKPLVPGKPVILSGDQLKKIQSCKEGIAARKLYQRPRDYVSLCALFMLLNDIPQFSPADALQMCHFYHFGTTFVTPDIKAKHPFRSDFMLKNDDIERWVRDPLYTAAMTWIVLEAYEPQRVIPVEDMMEINEAAMDETGTAMYDRLFEITLDRADRIKATDVLAAVRRVDGGVNHAKIKRELQVMMDDYCRKKKIVPFKIDVRIGRDRLYRGIKFRSNMDQMIMTGNGVAVEEDDGFSV